MLAAEIADVVAAVFRRMLRETREESPVANQIANLVGRQLRDPQPIEHRLQDHVLVVERMQRDRLAPLRDSFDLELPRPHAAGRRPEVDAAMIRQFIDMARQAVNPRIGGRRTDDHLHRNQLPRYDSAVLHASIAKRYVDAIGSEIGGAIVQQKFQRDLWIFRVKASQQRRDNLAAEAGRRADEQMAARRPVTQLPHVFQRLGDALHTRLTVLIEEFALARERRTACRAPEKTCVELSLEFLHVATDRRTADAKAIARASEAAFADNGQKRNDARVTGRKSACKRIVGAGGGAA